MSDSVEQAKASLERYQAANRARDLEGMIASMHFPHRRLSGENQFQVWETPEDFRGDNESRTAARESQGWGYSVANSIEAVQTGADKVHLAINFSRHQADGTEYYSFPSLWIFTRIHGRWGVQFRSSFLSGPMERGQSVG